MKLLVAISGGASLKQNWAMARPAQLKTLKNERQIGT
jgi:hypothetical protein